MAKIYVNLFHNKAIIINESAKTFKLLKATDVKESGFSYTAKMQRLIEIKNGLLQRGFARV